MLGGTLLAAGVAVVVAGSVTPGTDSTAYLVAGGALALIGGLGFVFIRRGHRATATLGRATPQEAAGTFSWTSDLNARWWGHVGGARFGIDRLQEETLETGAAYRVYYLPSDGGDWVLSLEREDAATAAEGS
jgi:LPXTG-motif cell wall-anchored protein